MPKLHIAAIVMLLVIGYCYESVTFFIFSLIFFIYTFMNRIVISTAGIKFKRKFISWDEIKTIGVSVTKKGKPRILFNKYIYISKTEYDMPVYIEPEQKYYGNPFISPPENVHRVFVEDIYIRASFNWRLICNIMDYWDTNIKNLEDTVGWKSYMRLYSLLHRQKKNK